MKYLVTVGTQKHQFDRLFTYVDKYLKDEEIVSQYGYSNYEGTFKFSDDLNKYMKECDVVITHGGVGSIMEALQLNKKVIAVCRLKKFNEHVDDHQLEIVTKLANNNYILKVETEQQFKEAIENIHSHVFNSYESNTDIFNQKLNEELTKL